MNPIDHASALFEKGFTDAARDVLLRALVAEPSSALLHNALGMIALSLETPEGDREARDEFLASRALEENETNGLNLAHAFRRLHDTSGEERALREVLARTPRSFDGLVNLGGLLADERNDPEEALACFMQAHELARTSDLAYDIALMNERLGRLKEARAFYLEGLRLPDPSEDLHVMAGLALRAVSLRRSARVFKKGLKAFPSSALLSYDLACCRLAQGKTKDATEWFARAFALDERYREYYRQDSEVMALAAQCVRKS